MACRKAADFALGKARVCGRAPAPGATGRGAGDLAALAGRIALPVGLAGCVGGGAVTAALARATDGDGDGAVEPAPHPASRTATMGTATSGARRDNLMPPPRHLAFSF
jgi:hypothetical protein